MKIDDLKTIHRLLVDDRWVDAATLALRFSGIRKLVNTKSEAVSVLRNLFQFLLDSEDYLGAATLQWGPDMFNTEPESVKRVFIAMREGSTVLLMGASSMSKSYAAGAWMLLDYLRDPLYTTVKLTAINEDHLRKNLFAHLATLYRNCLIPSRYDIQVRDSDLWMGVKDAGYEFGISGIAFKQSQETSGQLKGYKAKPVRMKPHPKFGVMGRLRVLSDEAQNYPGGPFKDFNSLIASKTGSELIKIVCAFNPESTSQLVVQMAEPEQGWLSEEMDSLYDYTSKADWRVCRLDAARSENVIQKKEIYRGLQTYEGFMSYLKAGGDSSANYSCADDKTELLSRNGWITYDKLKLGDEILTLDVKTGTSEYAPVREIFAKHYDGDLISMEGRGFSAFVTDNHRWAITDKGRLSRNKSDRLVFKETKDLKNYDLIPLCAKASDLPESDNYGPDFCELVGWVLSDGTFQELGHKKLGSKVCINQSITANAPKCDRIKKLLLRLNANCWEQEFNGIKFYNFSRDLAMRVRSVISKSKVLSFDFINSLSEPSLLSLIEGMMLGDGGFQGGATRYFCQKSELVASQFSMICARLGLATTSHRVLVKSTFGETMMTYVNVRQSMTTRPQNLEIKPVKYSGIVWCPRTKNGTFYARRNGTTYFTGNTFARGWPPMKGSINTIIPPAWPNEARGECTFIENPIVVAAVDLAFMGKDSAQMAIGRWGRASGWRNHMGAFTIFKDRINVAQDKSRYVLQIDQILPMNKHDDTTKMAEEIMARAKMLGIKPENLIIDKTSIGLGVHSHLNKVWGPSRGVSWNEKATTQKIVSEDLDGADAQCEGVMSEMWWTFRRWLDPRCCAILINPIIPTSPINTELTSRRYAPKGGKIKVEPKDAYKARNGGASPDSADALIMLTLLVRQIGDVLPGLVEEQKRNTSQSGDIKFEQPYKNPVVFETDDAIGSDHDGKDSLE